MNPERDVQPRARWPYPEDTPLQIARRIAIAYREHLKTANPTVCAALDEAVQAYGETWVTDQLVTVEADQMLTTAEAAELAGVDVETVRQWRKRGYMSRSGERQYLQVRGLSERGWPMFKAADVLEIAATTRQARLTRRG